MDELPIEFDPTKDINTILDDVESYLKLPLEDKTPPSYRLNECRHLKVYLDAQNRSVQCQDCKKMLDPFWYLQLLAQEWAFRRYEDIEALKAYREIMKKDRQSESRGKHFTRPDSSEGQKCWDAYQMLYNEKPDYVRARGKYWYVGKDSGEELGDYIKEKLAYKYRKMALPIPDCCG